MPAARFTKRLILMVVTAAALLVVALIQATDLDEGDPLCNVRVATATRFESHKPPRDMLKLQKRLRSIGIKTQLALLDRSPDLNRRVATDWFLTVYPADATRARHVVDEARVRGLRVQIPPADSEAVTLAPGRRS